MGKWRLLVRLSSPDGSSVNDGINPDEFTLHYIMVDQVIQSVLQFSRGALMAKCNKWSAYSNVPIHPSDRYLLGTKWRNQYYVDLALSFDLHSAPCFLNLTADMVEWILVHSYHIPVLLHYLDDFITTAPHPSDSQQHLHSLSFANSKAHLTMRGSMRALQRCL